MSVETEPEPAPSSDFALTPARRRWAVPRPTPKLIVGLAGALALTALAGAILYRDGVTPAELATYVARNCVRFYGGLAR